MSIRTALLPKDTNQHGTIFGGVILSHLDIAGAIEAKRFCEQEVVTVALKEVVFEEPVFVGDLVSFYTRIVATGRTSITVEVAVASFPETLKRSYCLVTKAVVVYVAVDEARKPTPLKVRASEIDPPAFAPEYLNSRLQADST